MIAWSRVSAVEPGTDTVTVTVIALLKESAKVLLVIVNGYPTPLTCELM